MMVDRQMASVQSFLLACEGISGALEIVGRYLLFHNSTAGFGAR